MRQWTFLLGPGVMAGVNDLFLGYLLYRSGLVPRVIPTIGLVGGPLILVSDLRRSSASGARPPRPASCSASPSPCSSFSLGVYLTVKGFRPAAVAALDAPTAPAPEAVAVA